MAKDYKDSELLKRLISVTEARRNFGSLISSLPEKGYLIFTKSGKPVAKIVDLTKAELKSKRKNKRRFGY